MPLSAKTDFDVERRSVSCGLYRDFTKRIQAGLYVSYINSDAYGGKSSNFPSIDADFSNSSSIAPITLWAPGLHSGSKVITLSAFPMLGRFGAITAPIKTRRSWAMTTLHLETGRRALEEASNTAMQSRW